jgi:hypothetical protein
MFVVSADLVQDPFDGQWFTYPGARSDEQGVRRFWSQLALIQLHGDELGSQLLQRRVWVQNQILDGDRLELIRVVL